MSEGSVADAASSLPIIKVHVMLPGGSAENDTYVSIKCSRGTTAEEVISHVSKKKQLPAVRFELVYLPSGDYTPSCVKTESIVLMGPAIISDIVSKVAVQGQGLWWLRETHEDSMARLVRRDTFNAKKGDPCQAATLAALRAAIIAEDADEGTSAILEDSDMAPALKEEAFVSRLIRKNSGHRRPEGLDDVVSSPAGTLGSFAEGDEEADAL